MPRWSSRAGRRSASSDLTDWWTDLPEAVRTAIEAKGAHLYLVEVERDRRDAGTERLLLGALVGTLRAEGRIEVKDRKLLDAFRAPRLRTGRGDGRRSSGSRPASNGSAG